jgi:hypothetical protein
VWCFIAPTEVQKIQEEIVWEAQTIPNAVGDIITIGIENRFPYILLIAESFIRGRSETVEDVQLPRAE